MEEPELEEQKGLERQFASGLAALEKTSFASDIGRDISVNSLERARGSHIEAQRNIDNGRVTDFLKPKHRFYDRTLKLILC